MDLDVQSFVQSCYTKKCGCFVSCFWTKPECFMTDMIIILYE